MELREDEHASRRPRRVHADVWIRVDSNPLEMVPEWYLMSGTVSPASLHRERSRIVGKMGSVEW